MTAPREVSRRLRWLLLVAGIVCVLGGLGWAILPYFGDAPLVEAIFVGDAEPMGLLGTPLNPGLLEGSRTGYTVSLVLVVGLLLLAQWAFLRPGRGFLGRMTARGRPMRSAVLVAALMAALLTTGLVALLLELPNWWEVLMSDGWGRVAMLWAGMLVVWGIWTCVFFLYWRAGDRYTWSTRVIRGLVAGSVLELLVAVPAHVLVTRQRECYCLRGTYSALVLAGVVLIWVFGPGLVLLFMRERLRRARLFPTCTRCGHELRGSIDAGREVCPECGHRIETNPATPDES